MKSLFGLFIITLLNIQVVLAQGEYISPPVLLESGEYYIDTEPGLGQAVSFQVDAQNAEASVENIEIDLTNLSKGFHRLVVRFKDKDGQWGIPRAMTFFVPEPQPTASVTDIELFFDQKTAIGSGSSVSISSPGTSQMETEYELDLKSLNLNSGFHIAYVRLKDSDNSWGNYKSFHFYLPKQRTLAEIDKAEYFYDNIVNAGSGESIDISNSMDGSITIEGLEINTPEQPGFHRVFVRFGDTDGDWGIPQVARFYMPAARTPQQVSQLEFFVNKKTNFGEGNVIDINPSSNFEQEIDVTTEQTGSGFSRIYIRAKDNDGQWGTYYSQLAYIPKERTDSTKITGLEYFIDSKTGLGEGNQVELDPTYKVSQEIEIPVENLNKGFSRVFVRLKDEKNNWGNYVSQLTYVNTERSNTKKITDLEYFLSGSSRPTEGAGVHLNPDNESGVFDSVSVSAKALITLNQGLGDHAVYVRAKDEDEQWGIPYPAPISITNQRMIQGILSESGSPKLETIVSLYNSGTFVKADTSSDYGLFTFAGLESGNYEVKYSPADTAVGRLILPYGSTGTIELTTSTNQLGNGDMTVTEPLHVIAVSPAPYDNRIRLNNPITLSFSSKYKPTSLTAANVSLISDLRGSMPITVSKQSNDSIVTISSSRAFLAGEKITLYLDSNYESADSKTVMPFTTHFRAQVSNGGTTFEEPVDMLIPRDTNYPPITATLLVADMDNDNDLDLLHYSVHNYTDTLLIYYNNGSGVYSDVQKKKLITESKNDQEAIYTQSYIFTGDYDKDGDVDVGVYHYDQTSSTFDGSYTKYKVQIYLYKNNGAGNLTYEAKYELYRLGYTTKTKFLYSNYSGKPIVMIPSVNNAEDVVFISYLGNSEFSESNAERNVQNFEMNYYSADVTGDGLLDLMPVSYNSNNEYIYPGDQNNLNDSFSQIVYTNRVYYIQDFVYDDFTRSNKIERLGLSSNSIGYLYTDNRSKYYFNTSTSFTLLSYGNLMGYSIGDLTNNGRIEIAVARGNRVDLYGYNPSLGAMESLAEIANFTSGTHSFPHLIDLDKDGDLDLVYKTEYGNLSRIHVRMNSSVSTNNKPTVSNTIDDKDIRLTDPVISESISSVFNDQDGDPLIYSVLSSKPSVVGVELDGSNLLITPLAIGNSTITLSADDDKGGVTSTEFIVYVNAPDNYTPRLASPIDDIETRVGDDSTVVALNTVFSDPDAGDVLSYNVSNPNASVATARIENQSLIIKPVSIGAITLTVTANDGKATAEDQFLVTVLARENRAPVLAQAMPNLTLNQGDAATEIDPLLYFDDPDDDELSFSVSSQNPSISSGSYNTSTKKLLITAAGAGSTQLTVTAKDPGNKEIQTSFTVYVNSKPRAIASIPDLQLVVGGLPATFLLSQLFTDDNGETLTYEVASGNGSVVGVSVNTVAEGKAVSFTAIAVGETNATLKAKDATTESGVITVSIVVKEQNFTSISSNDANSFYAAGIPIRGWTLFSVPGTGVNTTPSVLFGTATNNDFRVYTLNSNGEVSDQTDEAGSIIGTGDALWFKTLGPAQDFSIQTPAGQRIRERSRSIVVNGWRFVSNPYETDASWESNSSNLRLWKYVINDNNRDLGDWIAVGTNETLKPWAGYLAYSPSNNVLVVTPDQLNSLVSKQSELPAEEIMYSLLAQIHVGNQVLTISNRNEAKNEFDSFDEPLLPLTPESKERPAYIKGSTIALTTDARPFRNSVSERVEEFRTLVVPAGNEYITWTNPLLSEELRMAVINEDTYRILAPNDTLKIYQNGKTREFKVYFGTKEEIEAHVLPDSPLLFDNYPNPFNPTSTIRFALNKAGNVNLTVYDVLGRKVSTLVNAYQQQGYYTVQFNGLTLSSGIYLYRLSVNDQVISVKKMTLIK